MKTYIFTLIILLALGIQPALSQTDKQTDSQLAFEYYRNKEFDKAAVLYEKLYNKSHSRIYFSYYIRCLTELKEFKEAEKKIKRQLRGRNPDLTLYVELGNVYKLQNEKEKAEKTYQDAIKELPGNRNVIIQLANAFVSKREFEYAEQVYMKGRRKLGNTYFFHLELATVYTYQREYQKMINEYLELLDKDPDYLERVQNQLQYYIVEEGDDALRNLLRTNLLRRIQGNYDNISKTIYSELLIWLYIQEKNFKAALMQVKALDRRNNEDGQRLIELGKLAASNKAYDIAFDSYQYVIDKGKNSRYYALAKFGLLDVLYQKVLLGDINTTEEIEDLEKNYLSTINEFGRNQRTIGLLRDLAHLQAFYLDRAKEAIELLENTITIRGASPNFIAECKLELGDILILTGDIWEATLIYAEVEKVHKHSPIGHEAKFRKAKLAYYTGNFKWAQAQLDVLKASTSKLIANDALELSMLINDNTVLDTTETALQMYANAELLILQNKDSLALLTFDSIINNFKTHSLLDEILYKKATISKKHGNYQKAAGYWLKVVDDFGYDILADNALFELAKLYDWNLDDKQKAMEYYKRMLTDFPGSIYVVESRKRFRFLREKYGKTDQQKIKGFGD